MIAKTLLGPAAVLLLALAAPHGAVAFHEAGGQPEAGTRVYQGTCIACHGANGKGVIPGAPNFNAPDGPLGKPDEMLLLHVRDGFQQPGSPMPMPPKGGNPSLTEQDLKNVIAYLHRAFRQ